MFRHIQIIFILLVISTGCLFPWIPPICKSIMLGISLSLKSLIIFILPFLIFGLIFKTCSDLAKKASLGVLAILFAISFSNFATTMVSYFIGKFAYSLDLSIKLPEINEGLQPFFIFLLPKVISNGFAMFLGAFLGIALGNFLPMISKKMNLFLEGINKIILNGIVILIPIFILGFVVKLMDDGIFLSIIKSYSLIFGLVLGAIGIYIGLLYFMASSMKLKSCFQSIKNMLPAAFVGLGSMSSAAAMPFTVIGATKNTKNPHLAGSLIPATVNIHLMGDCLAIPIFAFAILKSFGQLDPSIITYIPFALAFVMAKFSVAAVPGGGILVMLPILESKLGLNGEMLSMITALYILFDPVITFANILGNGAFAQGIDKFLSLKRNIAN